MVARKQNITVLGSTGSIGVSTLDVLQRHSQSYQVYALTANTGVELLYQQIKAHQPRYAVMRDEESARQLNEQVTQAQLTTQVLAGDAALQDVASADTVDSVMAAIVGAAGLLPTLAAVNAGKRVLLANKEALVMAGAVFIDAVKRSGAQLLPIDSEHNAIFQCLPANQGEGLAGTGVKQLILTASGGPFRDLPLEQLPAVTPEQACAHPNWSMGKKISVDSATMMNKGLELIEACWLFDAKPSQVDIVVHRQSIVHSLVAYQDGSVLAQMGNPDMRTPIAFGLAWPQRIDAGVAQLDLSAIGQLDFEPLSPQRFPCVSLAAKAMEAGGTATTALNAANEVAVAAFLAGEIGFTDIAALVERVLQDYVAFEAGDIQVILEEDRRARAMAVDLTANLTANLTGTDS